MEHLAQLAMGKHKLKFSDSDYFGAFLETHFRCDDIFGYSKKFESDKK